MKKLIILIIALFFVTGCYDYKEINNLAFVSAIGVDYHDDKYTVTLEVLNDKVDKDSMKITSYIETGEDKSLARAVENATDKINKQANFTHTKLMIIGKNVAQTKLANITDFFLRSTYFRENIYVISSLNDSPEDILKTTTKRNPIASSAIIEILENNDYASNSAVLKTFDAITEEILAFGKDTCFSNIAIYDENFIIDGMVTYNGYDYAGVLDNDDATIYNIFINNTYRPIFSKSYDNEDFSIAVATGKPEATIEKNKLAINGKLTGKIMNNEPGFDIRNLEQLEKLNKDFKGILNKDFKEFLQKLQNNNSDILGITRNYYQKTRKKNKDLWRVLQVESNIEFKINKKGLIYEVTDEK